MKRLRKKLLPILIIFIILTLDLDVSVPVVNAAETVTIDVTGIVPGGATSHDCNRYLKAEYDGSYHWNRCFVCNTIYNKTAHRYTVVGQYGCSSYLGYQYNRCSCGYSYALPKKPHRTPYNGPYSRYDHPSCYKTCPDCGNWSESHNCTDVYGRELGCHTGISGTCRYCGVYRYASQHAYLAPGGNDTASWDSSQTTYTRTSNIVCSRCWKSFGTMTCKTWAIGEGKSGINCTFNLSGVQLSGNPYITSSWGIYAGNTDFVLTSKSFNGSGYLNVQGYAQAKRGSTRPSLVGLEVRDSIVGTSNFMPNVWIQGWAYTKTDLVKPTISGSPTLTYSYPVTYKGVTVSTNLRITAKYYEYYSDLVKVRLLDSDKTTPISDWNSCVQSGYYHTTSFNIIDEVIGSKTLYVQAMDEAGNYSSLTPITISNIDTKAPVPDVASSTSTEWSKTKTLTVKCTDKGFSDVQIAFNDRTNSMYGYRTANSPSTYNFEQTYILTGDVYGPRTGVLYMKDSVNNDVSRYYTIYNIDNTPPTITSVSGVENTVKTDINDTYVLITVNANDRNTKLNAEGSGANGNLQYYISTENIVPDENNSGWVSNKSIKVYEEGTHYLWAKDPVGNISNVYTINVRFPFVLTYDARLGTKGESVRRELTGLNDNAGEVSVSSKVDKSIKKVYYTEPYGELSTPRAGWVLNLYPHGTDNYIVQTESLDTYKSTRKVIPGTTGNKNYRQYVESTFKGWCRQLLSDIYLSKGYTGTMPKDNATDKCEDDANNVKVFKDLINMIRCDQTIYANWDNNSIKVGVPERNYTVTYDSNGGIFTENAGDSEGTKSYFAEHSWDFEGWYTSECTIQHTIGGTQDHKDINSAVSGENGFETNGADNYTPTSHVNLYAHWEDPGMLLPRVEKAGYEFIGWFSIPQSQKDKVTTLDYLKTIYYGGDYLSGWDFAHDLSLRSVDEDMTLYAWYNRRPIFVDIYDGLFFEGQNVSYYDLLQLVSIFDYEDDYYNAVIKEIYDLPEINKDDIYFEIQEDLDNDGIVDRGPNGEAPKYVFDSEHWEDLGDGKYKRKSDGKVFYTIESKMKLKDKIYASNLEVQIKSLEYKVTDGSLSSDLQLISGVNWLDNAELKTKWLDTSTSRILTTGIETSTDPEDYKNYTGDVIVTYTVTDNGYPCGGDLVIDSPITLNYTRTCTIQYNNAPLLYLRNIMDRNNNVNNTYIKNQLVLDAEDCVNNPPWWYLTVDDNDTGYQVPNGYSYNNLQNSIQEIGVWNIHLNTFLDTDVPNEEIQEFVSEWEVGKKLSDIIALKDNIDLMIGDVTGADIYNAILTFNIEFDCTDQFGKKASGGIDSSEFSGGQIVKDITNNTFSQSKEERSIVVYIMNDDRDTAMLPTENYEYVRYISMDWLSSLANNSYWNSDKYGYNKLLSILQTKETIDDNAVPNTHSGNTNKGVKVTIKDYS